MGYDTIAWLIIVVLSVLIEVGTAALVSIWFMPAGVVSLILSFFHVPLWVQIVVFFVLSFACLFVFRKFFAAKFKARSKETKTNLDTLYGQRAVVTEKIDNLTAVGAVRINGQTWSARAVEDEETIPEGTVVVIEKIQGVKLICRTWKGE